MKLIDGREFKIIDFGQYNPVESGPDFSNAKILIDGILWCGNVEIHIKSSDWFKHNHHKDPAYDNVILHVVLDSDRLVIQNGMTIPELRLADFIDKKHFSQFEQYYRHTKNWNCSGMLHLVPSDLFEDHINKFLIQRFKRKSVELSRYFNSVENRSAFFFLLARSFGMKVNQLPFEMLARLLQQIDFSHYNKSEHVNIILFTSGLYFPQSTKDKILYQKSGSKLEAVFSANAIESIKICLREVVASGTGKVANVNFKIYGKTGTSQNFHDAWFVGFNDEDIVKSTFSGT
jgi:hypothetical protein